jgi:O-antigen/teichoic acid export membrane protein
MNTLTDKTLRGGAWQFLSVLIQAFLQLVVISVLARYVLPEHFGIIALAGIATGFAHLLSDLGLGSALVQMKEINNTHIRVSFSFGILLALFVYLILWLIADPMSRFFHQTDVRSIIRIISLSIPIGSIGLTAHSLLERNLRFKELFLVSFMSYLFGYVPVGICLAVLDYGAWSLVAALLAQTVISCILLFKICPHSIVPSLASRELIQLLTYGGGHTLSKIFNFGAQKGDYFVVGRFLGAEVLGMYERAFRIMQLPGQYIGQVIFKVLFPAMARIQNQPLRLAKVYLSGLGIVNAILFPSSVILIVLSPELLLILLGPNWVDVTLPLQILLGGIAFRSTVGLSDSLSRAVGAVYQSAIRRAFYAFLVVGGSWIGHFWGLTGVAIGVNAAMMTHYLLMGSLSLKFIKKSWTKFFLCHVPGIFVGLMVLVLSAPLAIILRIAKVPSLFIFSSVIFVVGLSVICVLIKFPIILGADNIWVLELILGESPLRHSRLSKYLLFKLSINKSNE